MSTPNFRTQSEFDMYVYVPTYSEEEIKEWEEENQCEFNYEGSMHMDYEMEIENFNYLLPICEKKFGELKFFNIELMDGHYSGIQTYINNKNKYYSNPYEMDNEDCQSEYGMCRSLCIRKYESEIKKINKEILPYIKDNSSFEKLICTGIFSNGEAIYEYAK